MAKKTFDQWMKEVDAEIKRRTFLSYTDLPDVDYRGMYEDGKTPKGAASAAIKAANE